LKFEFLAYSIFTNLKKNAPFVTININKEYLMKIKRKHHLARSAATYLNSKTEKMNLS